MKIVKPSYQILDIPEIYDRVGILKFLELIGRTCYKSEDSITDESCVNYITMLRNRKHWAMLEHYIFVMEVPEWIYLELVDSASEIEEPWAYVEKSHFIRISSYEDDNGIIRYLVSFSATSLNYLYETANIEDYIGVKAIYNYMATRYPEIIVKSDEVVEPDEYDEELRLLSREQVHALPTNQRMLHDSMTVKFIASRGFTHELVRHRPASYAQESTRYCSYDKGKYGSEISVIEPFFKDHPERFRVWKLACEAAEKAYMDFMLIEGAVAQEARSVLPNSTKTEIVITARFGEWTHIFNMRADKPAHPEMKELMYPLLNEVVANNRECFESVAWRVEEGIENGWISAE